MQSQSWMFRASQVHVRPVVTNFDLHVGKEIKFLLHCCESSSSFMNSRFFTTVTNCLWYKRRTGNQQNILAFASWGERYKAVRCFNDNNYMKCMIHGCPRFCPDYTRFTQVQSSEFWDLRHLSSLASRTTRGFDALNSHAGRLYLQSCRLTWHESSAIALTFPTWIFLGDRSFFFLIKNVPTMHTSFKSLNVLYVDSFSQSL